MSSRWSSNPQHPYTQLLVGSIPLPDPDRAWHSEQPPGDGAGGGILVRTGRRFADRCPFVMPVYQEKVPPLFQIDPHRAAACFLNRKSPELDLNKMGQIFVGGQGSALVPDVSSERSLAFGKPRGLGLTKTEASWFVHADQVTSPGYAFRRRRGLASSSSPADRLNNPTKRMTITTMGGPHHHHMPWSNAA